jgi:hypothetical protein
VFQGVEMVQNHETGLERAWQVWKTSTRWRKSAAGQRESHNQIRHLTFSQRESLHVCSWISTLNRIRNTNWGLISVSLAISNTSPSDQHWTATFHHDYPSNKWKLGCL